MVRTMNKRLGKEERSMKMVIGEAWEQRDGKKRGRDQLYGGLEMKTRISVVLQDH